MKNLQSTIEGTWVELKQIQLTDEQKILLSSKDEANKEAVTALLAEIKSLKEVVAQKKDAALAQAKYERVKPRLKETDVYQLISFDIKSNNCIVNSRVNGEHKQFRF